MKRLIPLAAAACVAAVAFASSPASAQVPFKNCPEAYAAGRANIPKGDPQYAPHLDEDEDGFGCDKPPKDFVAKPTVPATTKAPSTTVAKAPSTTRGPVRATPRFTG